MSNFSWRTNELNETTSLLELLTLYQRLVDHDLRQPLLVVDGFATILAEQYRDRLPAEAQELLTLMTRGASRLGQLIEAQSSAMKRLYQLLPGEHQFPAIQPALVAHLAQSLDELTRILKDTSPSDSPGE